MPSSTISLGDREYVLRCRAVGCGDAGNARCSGKAKRWQLINRQITCALRRERQRHGRCCVCNSITTRAAARLLDDEECIKQPVRVLLSHVAPRSNCMCLHSTNNRSHTAGIVQAACAKQRRSVIEQMSCPPKGYIIARHVSDTQFVEADIKVYCWPQQMSHSSKRYIDRLAFSLTLCLKTPTRCTAWPMAADTMAPFVANCAWNLVSLHSFNAESRDVLQLSRTDGGIGLLHDMATCGIHAAIRGPTLLTPEDSQRGLR